MRKPIYRYFQVLRITESHIEFRITEKKLFLSGEHQPGTAILMTSLLDYVCCGSNGDRPQQKVGQFCSFVERFTENRFVHLAPPQADFVKTTLVVFAYLPYLFRFQRSINILFPPLVWFR